MFDTLASHDAAAETLEEFEFEACKHDRPKVTLTARQLQHQVQSAFASKQVLKEKD